MKTLITIVFAVCSGLSAWGQDAAKLYQTHGSHCHGDTFQGGLLAFDPDSREEGIKMVCSFDTDLKKNGLELLKVQ